MNKAKVLILCTGNSCRSQMAEGILRQVGGDLFEVFSAGSKPAGYVHPLAIKVMAELGLDLSQYFSKSVERFLSEPIDLVVTVCGKADQACPVFPGKVTRYHWPFEDPPHAVQAGETEEEAFRRVRDQISQVFSAYAAGYRDALQKSQA